MRTPPFNGHCPNCGMQIPCALLRGLSVNDRRQRRPRTRLANSYKCGATIAATRAAIDVPRLPAPHQTKMSFPDRRTADVFLIFVLAVFFAKLHERIAIGLGLASVMVIGITGSLASLGDTYRLSTIRADARFLGKQSVLLRLRLLHPAAAVAGSIYLLWVLWRFCGKRRRSQWNSFYAAH
jgi:hypothetical protein